MHLLVSDSSEPEKIAAKGPKTGVVHDGPPEHRNVAFTGHFGTIQTTNGSNKRSKMSGSKTEKFKSLTPRNDRHQ